MSLMLSIPRRILPFLCSAVVALAFCYGGASAQPVKEIKLTEKQVQGAIAAYNEMTKVYEKADPDKPDPKLDAQAEAVARKHGFASLTDYDDVWATISMIVSGIDPQTKRFTDAPDQIKKEIAALKADRSVPDSEKKEDLAQLEAALKDAKPVQFKENIALVLKHYEQLAPLTQDQDTKLRPAD